MYFLEIRKCFRIVGFYFFFFTVGEMIGGFGTKILFIPASVLCNEGHEIFRVCDLTPVHSSGSGCPSITKLALSSLKLIMVPPSKECSFIVFTCVRFPWCLIN